MKWEMVGLIVGSLGLLGGCLIPNRCLPPLPNDKLMHAGAFGALAWLGLGLTEGPLAAALLLGGLAIGGWLIECLQRLVPDRGFSWPDIVANLAGIAIAALVRYIAA